VEQVSFKSGVEHWNSEGSTDIASSDNENGMSMMQNSYCLIILLFNNTLIIIFIFKRKIELVERW